QIKVTYAAGKTVTVTDNANFVIAGPFVGNITSIVIDMGTLNDRVEMLGNVVNAPTRGITIAGGTGDDTLIGSDADETFIGGFGNDYMEGGKGSDTYQFEDQPNPEFDVVAELDIPAYGFDTLDFKTFNVTVVVDVDLEVNN